MSKFSSKFVKGLYWLLILFTALLYSYSHDYLGLLVLLHETILKLFNPGTKTKVVLTLISLVQLVLVIWHWGAGSPLAVLVGVLLLLRASLRA